eukprot:scaffold93786_cov57-Phaeocystis_antarctica.AAC.2
MLRRHRRTRGQPLAGPQPLAGRILALGARSGDGHALAGTVRGEGRKATPSPLLSIFFRSRATLLCERWQHGANATRHPPQLHAIDGVVSSILLLLPRLIYGLFCTRN